LDLHAVCHVLPQSLSWGKSRPAHGMVAWLASAPRCLDAVRNRLVGQTTVFPCLFRIPVIVTWTAPCTFFPEAKVVAAAASTNTSAIDASSVNVTPSAPLTPLT